MSTIRSHPIPARPPRDLRAARVGVRSAELLGAGAPRALQLGPARHVPPRARARARRRGSASAPGPIQRGASRPRPTGGSASSASRVAGCRCGSPTPTAAQSWVCRRSATSSSTRPSLRMGGGGELPLRRSRHRRLALSLILDGRHMAALRRRRPSPRCGAGQAGRARVGAPVADARRGADLEFGPARERAPYPRPQAQVARRTLPESHGRLRGALAPT